MREALPHEGHHETGSFASSSPVTDGRHVYASFGSYGLYCLDFEGHEQWHADFGTMQPLHGHGEGSSPALYADTLVVNWDHEEQSFLVALDKRTGKQRWRVAREEDTSWATPIVVELGGYFVVAPSRAETRELAEAAIREPAEKVVLLARYRREGAAADTGDDGRLWVDSDFPVKVRPDLALARSYDCRAMSQAPTMSR